MALNEEIQLARDTKATIVPAGEEHMLAAGTKAVVTQALGGSVTIRTEQGLYRIANADLDTLGESFTQKMRTEERHVVGTVDSEQPFSEDQVWEAMKRCFDPEIPVNVVDLGLIYDLQIKKSEARPEAHSVEVKMTLTAQGCGMGPVIADDVKRNIEALSGVSEAQVDIVWDPPWTPHMISDAGRKKMGIE